MNNTKNNNFVYALICLVCGLFISIVSSIYTFQMYFDFGYNSIDKFLTGCIGVAFDLGKIVFPILCGISIYKKHWGKIIVFGVLTVFCLVNSFIASQGRDLNIATIYKSEAINNSSEKLNNEESKKAKKAEISTQTSTINSLIDEKNKLPKNYITARKNKQAEIDTANKELKKLNTELNTLINKKFDSKSTGTVTKGMYQLAKWINPENPDSTIGTIAIIKNIATELIGIAFILGFGILLRSKDESENNDKPIPYSNDLIGSDNITVNQIADKNYSPMDDKIKHKKQIGFINQDTIKNLSTTELKAIPENRNVLKTIIPENNYRVTQAIDKNAKNEKIEILEIKNDTSNKTDITQDNDRNFNIEDIKEYLKFMYENSKNNKSVGQNKIKANTSLSDKQVRYIRLHLENAKIIKIEGNNTHILVDYDRAKKILNIV